MISVVIPAHNEEAVLPRCLGALRGDELDVVVVANACTDRTAELAREAGVRVIETDTQGKANALRLGDAQCRTFPRIYLDADVELSYASALALAKALGGGIMACAPTARLDLTGVSRLARRVHRVHDRLMAPRRALAGVGTYVLDERGHERVFPFPDVLADDEYVHRSFAPDERLVVSEAQVMVRPARTVRAHLRRRARVRRGNRELDALGKPAPEGRLGLGSLLALVRRRSVGPLDAACYLIVQGLDRILSRRGTPDWATDDTREAMS